MALTYSYQVPDVKCASCSGVIERQLQQASCLQGVRFAIDTVEKKLVLTFEDEALSYLEIRDLLNEILDDVGFVCVAEEFTPTVKAQPPVFSHGLMGFLGLSFGALFSLISLVFAPLSLLGMAVMVGLSSALTLILGMDSYLQAFKKVRKGLVVMDSLFAISTLTVIVVSVAALFFPALPMMCQAGLLIFGFRHIGLAIDSSLRQMHGITQRFQDSVPDTVRLVSEDSVQLVALSAITCDDRLQLSQGDTLPVDGVFESEAGLLINDCIITGSIKPRAVQSGERLYAGCKIIHASSPVILRAAAGMSQSHLVRLDTKITRAKLERSRLETTANQILQYFIPGVVTLALVSGAVVLSLLSLSLAIQCVVSILVSACPCTLGLIVPLAMKIGMKKAARHGIVFNSAQKLEAADNIQSVVFDLNGTLTEGTPRVLRYTSLRQSGLTQQAFIGLMAYFESTSAHPVALAIQQAGKNFLPVDAETSVALELNDHAGIARHWQGERYVLGSEAMLLRQGIERRAIQQLRAQIPSREGESTVFCARGGELIGYVVLHDKLRPHAKEMINKMIALNKTPYLCTGADERTALRYARALGIKPAHVRANCVSHASTDSPQSKKKVIDELKQKGLRVAAVGDGANDVEMIAASDFGIAIQSSGSDEKVLQQAAAVIHSNNLRPIEHAFAVAQQTVVNIKQNLWFSLLYNLCSALLMAGLLLAAGIVLNPAVGALLMIVQSSVILFNVARFAKQAPPAVRGLKSSNIRIPLHSYLHSMQPILSAHKRCSPEETVKNDQRSIDTLILPAEGIACGLLTRTDSTLVI